MMDLRHLRYFTAIAAAQNFTRAAERLGVAQPPLSRQMRELEEELGVVLIDRDVRPIRLTEAGRLFHEQAVRILTSAEQLRQSMQSLTQAGAQRFVIGFVGSIVYGAMPDTIRQFAKAMPGVKVKLLELTTIEQIAALKEGRIDAGLGRVRIDDVAVRREVLVEEQLVAAISSDHRLASSETITLSELALQTLIIYPSQPRPSYADQVLSLFLDNGLRPEQIEEVREVHTALGMVAANAGFTVVPSSLKSLRRHDLCYLPIDGRDAISPVILSIRATDVSEATQLFCNTARLMFNRSIDLR